MKPTVGRIVLYTLTDYDLDDQHQSQVGRTRPAVIVETWGNEKHDAFEMGSAVNLQVFVDGSNDGYPNSLLWKTSVLYSESARPGRWCWPPRT